MRLVSFLALAAMVGTGCSDPALEGRVVDLEQKVNNLETQIQNMPKGAAGVDAEAEKVAAGLIREAATAMRELNYDLAKKKLAEVKSKYGTTRAARSAKQLEDQVAVIGKPAGDLKVEKWYSSAQTDFATGDATLIVFWEEWCPHCKREVPKLQKAYDDYKGKGLNMVGLTRITKSSTEEKVTEFIRTNEITYPTAKEAGDMAEHFAVQGIPAAAMVKDGKVVWRGHPAQLNDEMIQGFLGS